MLPKVVRINSNRAHNVALPAGRAFIKSVDEILSIIPGQSALDKTAQKVEFAAGGDQFPAVLSVHRAPHLALAAPGACVHFNELPPG